MKSIHHSAKKKIIVLFAVLFISACATTSYIDINYRLPSQSTILAGRNIYLEVNDSRIGQPLFGPAAQKTFKYFTGKFALTMARENSKGFLIGAFDLLPLFQETVSRYLQNMGAQVLAKREKDKPYLKIDITSFHLDLIGRKWISDITYDALLIRDNQILAKQSVRGQAERAKITGSAQGQTVIGEIFTDVINRLDMNDLFLKTEL
ncbi:MAG: hypothetical protein JRE58_03285 [Deltaproteobacteria bacterium]|nr:hypothetical protein [Deltaproteobacteria bacterium]MBW2592019.1 hypothetical protein [Deltaproteobacteria bacterium]